MSNTPKQSTTPLYETEAVVQAVRKIVGEGQVTELRVLDAEFNGDRRWPYTASGYFDDATRLAEAVGDLRSAKGIYIIPNPVDPDLLARANNRIRRVQKGESTQDTNILRRRWLMLDMDAQRPSGISASEDEHIAAIDRARSVFTYLKAAGWPDPIAADSGNGAHLLYRIDLPTDDGGLVQRCLVALARLFDDEVVKIDQTVFNAGRIWKLYGTLACKGDDTPERPHRMARILSAPNEIGVVRRTLLEALAEEAAEDQPHHARQHHASRNGSGFDLAVFIERHGLDVRGPEPWNGQQGRGQRWVFQSSPMCKHNDGAAHIEQHAGGAVSAGCHHNSCSWNWLDLRRRFEPDSQKAANSGAPASHSGSATPEPVLVRVADVPPEEVKWLWPGRIPAGKLTQLSGDPGKGKSFLTLDIAARVSQGMPWPDNPDNVALRGSVILLSAEDGIADTIRPRLDAAGADVSSILVLKAIRGGDKEGDRLVDLTRDLPVVERAVQQTPDCRFVVIDPISAYLGGTDSHKNAEMRGLLAPLAELAQRHGVAVLAVNHLTKGEAKAMYRSMGSLAFVAAARAAWIVAEDKDDLERRLLLPVKNNLAPDIHGLAYRIISPNGAPVVQWEQGAVDMSADEALGCSADGERGSALEEAVDWLRHTLADGPVGANEVKERAKADGIKERTLTRAKKALGVISDPDGFRGPWVWKLPGSSDSTPVSPQIATQETLAHSDKTGVLCGESDDWGQV